MLFQEALELLKSGEAMHREAWPESEGYLKILPGMLHVWKIMLVPNPNAGNFIFSIEDFYATDWKKFEMPGTVVDACVEVAEAA